DVLIGHKVVAGAPRGRQNVGLLTHRQRRTLVAVKAGAQLQHGGAVEGDLVFQPQKVEVRVALQGDGNRIERRDPRVLQVLNVEQGIGSQHVARGQVHAHAGKIVNSPHPVGVLAVGKLLDDVVVVLAFMGKI